MGDLVVSPKLKIKMYFYILWLLIGTVSAFDVYMSVEYQNTLYEAEMNPLGRYLMDIKDGEISLFMGCKSLGTIFTLGILCLLWENHKRIALGVITGVAVFQLLLLILLMIG